MSHINRSCGILPAYALGFVMAAVLGNLPAAALAQSKPSVEERVAKLERMLETGTLLQLLQSVQELKAEVRELRGELELQGHAVTQMKNRQRNLYLDVDRRLQRVEGSAAAVAGATGTASAAVGAGVAAGAGTITATPVPGSAPSAPASASGAQTTVATAAPAAGAAAGAASVDPVKEQRAYQDAFNLLKAGRYDQASKSFRRFLADYPESKYSDNAQYWLGESYYVTRSFDNAMREFERLVNEHPDSQKLTHALLKIGYIHDELGQKEQAQKVLTELAQNYPQSTAAGLARKRLQRLRSE